VKSTTKDDDNDHSNDLNWVWAVVGVVGGLFLMYGGVVIFI